LKNVEKPMPKGKTFAREKKNQSHQGPPKPKERKRQREKNTKTPPAAACRKGKKGHRKGGTTLTKKRT